MRHNWLYLLEQDVAPVWVGELGSGRHPSVGGAPVLAEPVAAAQGGGCRLWLLALNPVKQYESTVETYGLVEGDWETPVLDYRMKDMVELMRQ